MTEVKKTGRRGLLKGVAVAAGAIMPGFSASISTIFGKVASVTTLAAAS